MLIFKSTIFLMLPFLHFSYAYSDNEGDLKTSTSKFRSSDKVVTQITAGGDHTCAIFQNKVKCWGSNEDRQLQVPRGTKGIKNPKMISTSIYHSCVIDDEGVKCWGGYNVSGELDVPKNIKNPTSIALDSDLSCAIDDGVVKCWGDSKGIKGPEGTKAQNITFGAGRICIIDLTDHVQCWGHEGPLPLQVHLKEIKQFVMDSHDACAIDSDGLKCWGKNLEGRTEVPNNLKNPKLVTLGERHTCVVDDEGIKCWGNNSEGQCDVPESILHSQPTQIVVGWMHSCALIEGRVKCWGNNEVGQTRVPEAFKLR